MFKDSPCRVDNNRGSKLSCAYRRLTILPKGRHAPGRRVGKNVVLLTPGVAVAFPTDVQYSLEYLQEVQ